MNLLELYAKMKASVVKETDEEREYRLERRKKETRQRELDYKKNFTKKGINTDVIITWGKHYGEPIDKVSKNYLEWFAKNGYDSMAKQKQIVIKELSRRKNIINN